jgi:carbon monoxide dehydrogenase subunit G
MTINDQGHFAIAAPPADVYRFMTDPEFLGRSLPDARGYAVESEHQFTATLLVGVSHIRGTMPTRFEIVGEGPSQPCRIRAQARGLGSQVDVSLEFKLRPVAGQTEVDWHSAATVSGLLASVGAGVLKPVAQRNFNAIIAAIEAALEKAVLEGGPNA